MANLFGKIFSGIIGVGYIIFAYFLGGNIVMNFATIIIFLAISLSCIWFSDSIGGMHLPSPGSYTGNVINEPSPPSLVKIVGWGLLFLPVVVFALGYFITLR